MHACCFAGGALLTLFGTPSDVAPPLGATGAACRFQAAAGGGGGATAAARWAAAPVPSVQQGLTCAAPPAGAPRFVALSLTWLAADEPPPPPPGAPAPPVATGAAAANADAALAPSVQFEYRAAPTLRRAFPDAAPREGGVLVALTGAGFDPAAPGDAACAFSLGGADAAADAAPTTSSPGAAPSSALLLCEVPAARGARAAEEVSVGAGAAASAALPFFRAAPPAALGARPRGGDAHGGTLVALRGSHLRSGDLAAHCQVRRWLACGGACGRAD
jgi:hypothetical protein